MKKIIAAVLFFCLIISGCAPEETPKTQKENGTIYLYGERHNDERIMALELELWQKYYNEEGMRHLFVEYSYYAGELLNQWMQAEDDEILDDIFLSWRGTSAGGDDNREFLKAIKETCPETIFHGTDIGHGYNTLGARYLYRLKEQGLEDTEEYRLTEEAMKQGRVYYGSDEPNHAYRENAMTENFIREYEALEGESVMGIYGAAHTYIDTLNVSGECDCMGKQLFAKYGEKVISEDLYISVMESSEPISESVVIINGEKKKAFCYGSEDMSISFPEYEKREFWEIEGAYDMSRVTW